MATEENTYNEFLQFRFSEGLQRMNKLMINNKLQFEANGLEIGTLSGAEIFVGKFDMVKFKQKIKELQATEPLNDDEIIQHLRYDISEKSSLNYLL